VEFTSQVSSRIHLSISKTRESHQSCAMWLLPSTETIVPHIHRIMYFSVMLLMWNNDY